MKQSHSSYLEIRGLRYHVRSWGPPEVPPVIFLHGWMDASASFQFVADALKAERRILAPDWRGEGLSAWANSSAYDYSEYVADLDALVDQLHPGKPADIVGHSRGGNIATLYAGIRPDRVRRVVNIEGFGLRARPPEETPVHLALWLAEFRAPPKVRTHPDFPALGGRLRRPHPPPAAARA